MYRHPILRVACAACGVEEPLSRMDFSPHGGHWCWRCQVSAQIAEHAPRGLYGGPPRTLSRVVHGAIWTVGVGATVLLVGYFFLWIVAIFTFRC
jgi:hypothetical protein